MERDDIPDHDVNMMKFHDINMSQPISGDTM